MQKEGLAGLREEKVFFTLECPNCHYRLEKTASGPIERKKLHLR
jgi:hypothetical protein